MNDFDYAIAKRTVWGEARSEPQDAWAGVAWSFRNRVTVNPKRYGASIAEVCLRPLQYDCWHPGPPPGAINHNPNAWANWLSTITVEEATSTEFVVLSQVVDSVLADLLPDPTSGATHYWDDSIKAPFWATSATYTKKIGRLQFVRDVK